VHSPHGTPAIAPRGGTTVQITIADPPGRSE
jgi:hypothetical protein